MFIYSSLFVQVLQFNFTLMKRMSLEDFFQDCIIKATFSSYSELIMVDAICKFSEFRMSLYLFLLLMTIINQVKSLECI